MSVWTQRTTIVDMRNVLENLGSKKRVATSSNVEQFAGSTRASWDWSGWCGAFEPLAWLKQRHSDNILAREHAKPGRDQIDHPAQP